MSLEQSLLFLLIGERVEGFVQSQNFVSDDFVSLALPREFSFWILVAWITSCLSASIFIVFLYREKEYRTVDESTALLAACIDASLFSLMCSVPSHRYVFISFLLISKLAPAEGQRCCQIDSSGTRQLAGDETGLSNPATICTCSRFGSRLYGGLGNIEPFTSLVCLRIFRHWIAHQAIEMMSEETPTPPR